MILSENKKYYLIKWINGKLYYLSLLSFKFFPGIDYNEGCLTIEDLQHVIDTFCSKTDLTGSKIVTITTTKVLNEE
jgi:hypothetical protein